MGEIQIFLVILCFLKRKGPLLRGPRGSFLSEKARSSNLISGPQGPKGPWSEHFNFKPTMAQAPKDRTKKNKRGFKLLI